MCLYYIKDNGVLEKTFHMKRTEKLRKEYYVLMITERLCFGVCVSLLSRRSKAERILFRSTYLDTELMLMIDCPELNDMLREDATAKMDMSRHVMPDGTESLGVDFTEKEMPLIRRISSELLKIFSGLFRHLL